MKRTLVVLTLLVGFGVSAISASAQQITLGASTQNVTFIADGAGILDLQMGTCLAGTCTLSGNALGADGEAGTYSFVTSIGTDFPDFGPNNGSGVFPLSTTDGTTTQFTFTDTTDGDSSFSVPITYVSVSNGSTNPHINFTTSLSVLEDDVITKQLSCTGLPPGTACNIDNVASTGAPATAFAQVSAGEVNIPEPASMALLGTALFGAYGLLRRRIRPS